jgi:hypothetical protein
LPRESFFFGNAIRVFVSSLTLFALFGDIAELILTSHNTDVGEESLEKKF